MLMIVLTLALREARRRVAQPPVGRVIGSAFDTPSNARRFAAVVRTTAAQPAS